MSLSPVRLLMVLVVFLGPGFAAKATAQLFKVANQSEISLVEMVQDLTTARVIFIGERHDRREHHEAQLAVIQALTYAGARIAVGAEMFRADAQDELDRWVRARMESRDFYRLFAANWDGRLWPLYSDIFFHARRQGIPLVGLNVQRSLVSQVARDGFASLDAVQRSQLGVVSCDVSEKYQDLIRRVLGHQDPNTRTFGLFCEAQVVWDTAMARNALRYLEAHPDRTLVVLAGNFHAWKHGIPEQLSRLSDVPYRVILPSSDDGYPHYELVLEDADYVWWTE